MANNNPFVKAAYDVGAQHALNELGIKEANIGMDALRYMGRGAQKAMGRGATSLHPPRAPVTFNPPGGGPVNVPARGGFREGLANRMSGAGEWMGQHEALTGGLGVGAAGLGTLGAGAILGRATSPEPPPPPRAWSMDSFRNLVGM